MGSNLRISTILVLVILLHSTASDKSNARPVYEVINEQARSDDKIKITSGPSMLPYGNPLAGNSKQNARIHISNQQAMFNAERVRQHRAQLQQLAKGPLLVDSYMKAYHDSQDNHQLALEQQQASIRENLAAKPSTRIQNNPATKTKIQNNSSRKRIPNNPEHILKTKENLEQKEESLRKNPESRKTTDRSSVRGMKFRNQRSYGPIEYQQYLYPQGYNLNYVASDQKYDQGVTIKPNGNIGLQKEFKNAQESTKLYTEAVPGNIKYIYPKQYSQIQNYKALEQTENHDRFPEYTQEQLSELSSLQNSANDANDVPIDFYFYLKNPTKGISEQLSQTKYAQLSNNYASAYASDYVKDHTPITEEVDDIEDPNAVKRIIPPTPQPETTAAPEETTSIKTNHYYKIEVASQTLSSEHKPKKIKEYFKQEDTPAYAELQYPSRYFEHTSDTNERYLHHNAKHIGVHHLTQDGTGVSAYGNDEVSNNNLTTNVNTRHKRSELDTSAFLTPDTNLNETIPTALDTPASESLIRLNPSKKIGSNNFNLFLSPNLQANDNDEDYPLQINHDVENYDDNDYNDYDETLGSDYSVTTNIRPVVNFDTNYHLDSQGSYASNYKYSKRIPNHNRILSTTYSYPTLYNHHPEIHSQKLNLPLNYGIPTVNTLANLGNLLEPVYMITQTELKQLLNQQKLNIEHLDVFQLPNSNKPKRTPHPHFPRYHKNKYPFRYRNRKIKSKLHKLHKFF